MEYAQFRWLSLGAIAIAILVIEHFPLETLLAVAAGAVGLYLLDRRMAQVKKEKKPQRLFDYPIEQQNPKAPRHKKEVAPPGTKHCTNCGEPILDPARAKLCSNCGHPLPEA